MTDSTHAIALTADQEMFVRACLVETMRCSCCRQHLPQPAFAPKVWDKRKGGYCRSCAAGYAQRYWTNKDPKRIICEKCGKARARGTKGCCRCEFTTCLHCGKEFDPKRGGGQYPKYCTKECASKFSYQQRRSDLMAARTPKARECPWCFTTFTPESPKQSQQIYCTFACSRSARRHYETHRAPDRCHIPMCKLCGKFIPMRAATAKAGYQQMCAECDRRPTRIGKVGAAKARLPDGSKTSVGQIAERDGWICWLCGESVDPEVNTLDRMGATLDHVIPLARGGTHTLGNLRLAHRGCNSRKGARVGRSAPRRKPGVSASALF